MPLVDDSAISTGEFDEPLVILLPLFNDWPALDELLVRLDDVLERHNLPARVLVVNDGSTVAPVPAATPGFRALDRVDVLHLRRNLGHQRAIAVGLAYIEDRVPCRAVVVMDSDGEDSPQDVPRLVARLESEGGGKIVFAERTKRSESWVFRICYVLFRALHYVLTGKLIRAGNFSVIPRCRLSSLVVVSEIWNHYATAVVKSKQPYCSIPTERAKRLKGRSQMNFVNLVVHGLSAISVHSEVVGVRLLVLALLMIGLALTGVAIVVTIRLTTALAIPGWATNTVGMLVIILVLAVMLAFFLSFVILGSRQMLTFMPRRDYVYFVENVRELYGSRPAAVACPAK